MFISLKKAYSLSCVPFVPEGTKPRYWDFLESGAKTEEMVRQHAWVPWDMVGEDPCLSCEFNMDATPVPMVLA